MPTNSMNDGSFTNKPQFVSIFSYHFLWWLWNNHCHFEQWVLGVEELVELWCEVMGAHFPSLNWIVNAIGCQTLKWKCVFSLSFSLCCSLIWHFLHDLWVFFELFKVWSLVINCAHCNVCHVMKNCGMKVNKPHEHTNYIAR